jgi:putative phosphotransacetylase
MALITETELRAQLPKGIRNPYPIGLSDKLTPAAADFLKSRGILVVRSSTEATAPMDRIPVGVSNRHVHLSQVHVERLFGPGYQLTPMRELSQQGQFAAEETVTLVGQRGSLKKVRILGPARDASQVEISRTDSFVLGIHAPLRLSGHIQGTPGIILRTDKGELTLQEGLIIAQNHVHMSTEEARMFQVVEGDRLIVQTMGDRPVIFTDVAVRVNPRFSLDLHIDTDEANAAWLATGEIVHVIGKNGQLLPSGKEEVNRWR